MKPLKGSLLAASLLGLAAAVPTSASAALVLTVDDGVNAKQVVIDETTIGGTSDSGLIANVNDDSLGQAGIVQFDGSLGSWSVLLALGSSKPALGTATLAQMDLVSVTISGGSGSLRIELTDTGFDAGTAGSDLTFGAFADGNTTGQSVRFQAYADDANQELGTSSLLHDSGLMGGTQFSSYDYSTVNLVDSYSLTLVAEVNHGGSHQITSFDYLIKVPEPASLALLGLGLIGIAAAGKRRAA